MSRKADIELRLWRSKLLRKSIATGALQDACAVAARAVAKLESVALAECSGVPQGWDSARREPLMGLTESDTARLEKTRATAQNALRAALAPFLTPGCVWKFYSDPRGGMVRIRDGANRRDVWL